MSREVSVQKPNVWDPLGLKSFAERTSLRYLPKSTNGKSPELPPARMLSTSARYHRPLELLSHVRYVCDLAANFRKSDEDRAWCTIEMAVGIMIGSTLNVSIDDCVKALKGENS